VDINEIIDKLKDILSCEIPNRKVFDKDVAAALGLSKESLSHLKRRGAVPYEQISLFCAKRKISINWILFNQLPKSLEEETEKYTRIRYFSDVNASAGGGGFNYDEDYTYLGIDKILLDSLYKSNNSNPNSIIALNVIGDSMEPTLYDKEIILFDKENKDISKGGIFVVSTNAGLFVKRVAKKIDGSVELISDNKNYNSEIIKEEELSTLNLLGKVIGKVSAV
jgi:phage repressor protein C with HTH and peptisase S24 domain